ncbi:hypothetical protein [Halobacillus sp. BBL2006]|uniref:hypothetical protein n=1 Tax=Halobacillus sp. BBL2006 TaxID=1543706 RepID=UPI0012E034A7|nr:hypothetical protein [Halobacillus sp. BBL2006]
MTIVMSVVAAIVFFMCLERLNYEFFLYDFIEENNRSILSFRDNILLILFRFSPFIVSVVIAISSLTVNSFTGSFFANLISDNTLKVLIVYTLFYIIFHSFTNWYYPTTGDLVVTDNYSAIIFFDTTLALMNILLALVTSVHVFYYTWPKTLKDKFGKEIRKYIDKFDYTKNVNRSEIEENKRKLNRYIIWFTNLLSDSIKSKDFELIEDTILDMVDIWEYMISINATKQKQLDDLFEDMVDNTDDATIEEIDKLENAPFSGVYKECLRNIQSVFRDAFEQGYREKDLFVCQVLLDNLVRLTKNGTGLNRDDINKVLDIYLSLYKISIKEENDKYSNLSIKIMENTNLIYKSENYKIQDLNNIYWYLYYCITRGEDKYLKVALGYLQDILDSSYVNKNVYERTINQLHELLLFSLKRKRMRCFANLIRFTVTSNLNLDIINKQMVSKIKQEDILDIEEILDDLGFSNWSNLSKNDPDYYYNTKIFVVWRSYYLLQKIVSPDRIDQDYSQLSVSQIKNKISFKTISTLIMDLETFITYWDELFIKQASHFFLLSCSEIVKKREINEKIDGLQQNIGNSEMICLLKSYVN